MGRIQKQWDGSLSIGDSIVPDSVWISLSLAKPRDHGNRGESGGPGTVVQIPEIGGPAAYGV
jgi:hypothetical protein